MRLSRPGPSCSVLGSLSQSLRSLLFGLSARLTDAVGFLAGPPTEPVVEVAELLFVENALKHVVMTSSAP